MPKETKTGKCLAKNPPTCRVHGPKLIVDNAIAFVIDKYSIRREHEKELLLRIAPDIEELIEPLMKDALTNAKKQDSKKKDNWTEYFSANDVFESVKQAFYSKKVRDNQDFSIFAGHLVTPVADQILIAVNRERKPLLPEDNFLNKEAKGEEGYKVLLAKLLKDKGYPVSARDTYYGWLDAESKAHIDSCGGIEYISKVYEDQWSEFAGTFADNDNTKHGITGDAICACRGWRGKIRWTGSISDAIQEAFKYFT